MSNVLHYFYDPLCGWCYAAEALVQAVEKAASAQLRIQLHGGGLFQKTYLPAVKRAHIKAADARIGELTGQSFGTAYLNGLLDDPETVYDSTPPIAAVLAADQVQPGAALTLLKAIQHAHYRDGRPVVQPQVLADIAEAIGLERTAFLQAYENSSTQEAEQHIGETRDFMNQAGIQGFPAFLLQTGNRFKLLRHELYYSKPEAFGLLLSRQEQ